MTAQPQPGDPSILRGVRVIEIASGTAVAYCAELLGQMGAEVIRIEPPGGDEVRLAGPVAGDRADPDGGGLHRFLNAGKRSVVLDLADESSAVLAGELIRSSALLVTSWKAPGLLPIADPEGMRPAFPATTVVSISPFGRTGPYADWVADSHVLEAMSGLSYVSGAPDREPLALGVDAADYFGALAGWIAALAVLFEEDDARRPRYVDISSLEALTGADDHSTSVYVGTGAIRRRFYSRVMISYPSDIMRCKDGYIAFVPGGADFGSRVCEMIERPDLVNHELMVDAPERVSRWREFNELVDPWLLSHSVEELLQQSDSLHMAFAAVPTVAELIADPHLSDREFWVEDETGELVMGPAAQFSRTPLRVAQRPPDLDADGAVLRQELGRK